MEMYVVTLFFLALLSGSSHGAGVLPDNMDGALGGSVMFTTTINPPFVVVEWIYINDVSLTVIIQSTLTGILLTGSGYKDRITLNTSPVSLELRNLTFNDSGEYRVTISGGGRLEGSTNLKIYKKISGAVITPSTVQPVEGRSTNMTCDAEGTISTRDWMKDGRPLTPSSDITLHDSNRVLSFSAVNKTDNGEYLCRVSNPVSSQEATYNMMVNVNLSGSVEHTPPSRGGVVGLIVGLLVAIPLTILLVLLCRYRTSKDPCCVRPVQSQGTNQSSAADQRTNQSGAPDDLYSQLQHGDTSVYGVITPSDVYANVPRTAAAAAVVFTNLHSAP